MRFRTAILLALTAALAVGCETDDPAGPDISNEGPLYIVHSALESPDGRVNYFTATNTLASGELDYGHSLTLMGRPRLYAQEGLGYFAVANAEDVEITRYTIDDEGHFVAGDTISLHHHGVRSLGAQAVYFASPTRAYYKDPNEAQVIVWNPEEMVVEKTIDLPASLIRENRVTSFGDWVAREGEAYFTVGWTSQTYDRVDPGLALVRIDTTTDEVTITEDDRCRGIETAANVDGTLYFFSGVISPFGYHVYGNDGGQPDCILRIVPGETTFDADWVGSLAASLPDGTAATAATVDENGRVWVQVVDLSTAPSAEGTTYGEWYAADWTWWHLQVPGFDEAVRAPSAAGAYSSFTVGTEDAFYISQTASDYSETTLIDLSGESAVPGLNLPGFVLDIVRIR